MKLHENVTQLIEKFSFCKHDILAIFKEHWDSKTWIVIIYEFMKPIQIPFNIFHTCYDILITCMIFHNKRFWSFLEVSYTLYLLCFIVFFLFLDFSWLVKQHLYSAVHDSRLHVLLVHYAVVFPIILILPFAKVTLLCFDAWGASAVDISSSGNMCDL